jgi:hypothetical protein
MSNIGQYELTQFNPIAMTDSKLLKLLCLLIFSSIFFEYTKSQGIAINNNGAAPDASAILDVQSGSKGMMIPQVSLTALNAAAPLANPAHSLLVYNTNTTISGGEGYYYNSGTGASPNWVKMVPSDTSTVVIDDMRTPLDKGTNSAQLGSLTGVSGPEIWFFRYGEGIEAMSFTVQLPHNWKVGSVIHPHIHWVPRISGSGNVKWNLDYSWVNLNESAPETVPAITTTSAVVNGPFTMNKHILTPLTTNDVGISGTGKTVSSILICRIWRNTSDGIDTFQGDAGGLSVDFHIQLINPFR